MTDDKPNSMTAQDRLDVIELIGAYAHYLDSGDVDGYMSTFAPNSEFHGAHGVIKGEALREFTKELIRTGEAGPNAPRIIHFMGMPFIEGTGERCSIETYIIWFRPDEAHGGVRVPSVGTYTDTCVKVDGRWLFEKRIIRHDLGAERA